MFKILQKRKQRDRVRQLLQGHMNRGYAPQIGKTDRKHERREFCEVVWVIGWDEKSRKPDLDHIRHAVARDISDEGLSLLLTTSVDDEQLLIGLDNNGGRHFLRCLLKHCTPLGHGFYQVGLYVDEVVELDPLDIERLKQTARPHTENLAETMTVSNGI